jgi:hypothetical protein
VIQQILFRYTFTSGKADVNLMAADRTPAYGQSTTDLPPRNPSSSLKNNIQGESLLPFKPPIDSCRLFIVTSDGRFRVRFVQLGMKTLWLHKTTMAY